MKACNVIRGTVALLFRSGSIEIDLAAPHTGGGIHNQPLLDDGTPSFIITDQSSACAVISAHEELMPQSPFCLSGSARGGFLAEFSV